MMFRTHSWIIAMTWALTACAGLAPQAAAPVVAPGAALAAGTDGYPWWNDTIFYEIFVRSFYDSNGDGIGDINGIIAKLDYLNDGDPNTTGDLGVTGIWLMPIHPSPSYHGYDVTDYYAVNPDYGTLGDFKRLLFEAHRRGISVVIDFVLNHTSSQHSWFIQAQDQSSAFHDWYVWSDTQPSGSGWHTAAHGEYYYGFFWEGMPDLNYNNPAVTAEMEKAARFWLQEVGVDGFRLDAVRYLIEEDGLQFDTDSTHAWYKQFRPVYKSANPQAVTIGEVWASNDAAAQYVAGDELDLAFSFDLAKAIITAVNNRQAAPLGNVMASTYAAFKPGQFAVFLTNHDMNRVMTQFVGSVDKAKVAATILLTSAGVPFIYYGEEIGMLGGKPDEKIRTPMQWSPDANGGFTAGAPWEAVNADYTKKNVAAQSADPESLLSRYRALIALRAQHPALRVGDFLNIKSSRAPVLASLRWSKEEAVLVVINLDRDAVEGYSLSLVSGPLPAGAYKCHSLLDDDSVVDLTVDAQGGFKDYQPRASLPPGAAVLCYFALP